MLSSAPRRFPAQWRRGRTESASKQSDAQRSASCKAARLRLHTIHLDGMWMVEMVGKVQELRPRAADSEKITINLGYVDLGHIDLMVKENFYSNRTDFIRTAIRNQLERH